MEPLKAGSICLDEVPEPDAHLGSVLVEAVAAGVCGTDVEIADGKYGWAPPANRVWCSAMSPWDVFWILVRRAD